MLFAHLERILRLDRLRLRGPCGAQDEFLLAATVHRKADPNAAVGDGWQPPPAAHYPSIIKQKTSIIYRGGQQVRHVRMNQSHPAKVTPSW
jgi:hypothetical protein